MLRIVLVTATLLLLGAEAKISPKTPSDVYSHAMILKQEVAYLRRQAGIEEAFPEVEVSRNKRPRHVIQKALEIISKINRYRLIKGYGAISLPPYPAREIRPQDVYDIVVRLDGEVQMLIHDKGFFDTLEVKRYYGKTPSDVYQLLWSISLAMDPLLGMHGYTPTDVYELSEKIVKISTFLRQSQNIYDKVEKPPRRDNLYPNHAFYAGIDFLKKVSKGEAYLWMEPVEIPERPHKTVTPTEVYDLLQNDIAELQRIKYRLGLERYFKTRKSETSKTPSDVVRNLEYARALLPAFDFSRPLVQYPKSSLVKTSNQVYAVTEEILRKLQRLKQIKGVRLTPKDPPKIEGLKPIHTYQKGIEAMEKALRLKVQMGFYPAYVASMPFRRITPTEVYDLVVRLDAVVTLLLQKAGDTEATEYIYGIGHPEYKHKTMSDVYYNLWLISRYFDQLSGTEYTPNETFILAKRIEEKVDIVLDTFHIEKRVHVAREEVGNRIPKDVFVLANRVYGQIKALQERANFETSDILIPREEVVTPNTVYNALRLINASLNEFLIDAGIDAESYRGYSRKIEGKTPSDVYAVVETISRKLDLLFLNEVYDAR
ncbi:hypothetical protein [Hydrogenimonas sp.]